MAELEKKYQELKNRLSEIYDLDMVGALLSWDLSTYMPSDGAEARGRQSPLLTCLSMERPVNTEACGRQSQLLTCLSTERPVDTEKVRNIVQPVRIGKAVISLYCYQVYYELFAD